MTKEIWMPVGLPGCGKSTYLRNKAAFQPATILSSDMIRQELTGNMSDLSKDPQVWKLYEDRFVQALRSDAPEAQLIVLDSTFLNEKKRKGFIDHIKQHSSSAVLRVFEFTANVKDSLSQQKKRDRQVPDFVVSKMASSFSPFNPSTEAEGLRVEKKVVNPGEALPNPEKPVAFQPEKTAGALEKQLEKLGFWREGTAWSSARAAKLVVKLKTLKALPAPVRQILQQLVDKGFAMGVSESREAKKRKEAS